MKTVVFGILVTVLAWTPVTAMAMGSRMKGVGEAGSQPGAAVSESEVSAPDIDLADLKQAMKDKSVVLLDCNGSEYYAKGHIPGAIDFEAAEDDLAKQLPKDKSVLVVAYCGGPKCLAYKAGVNASAKLGYTNLRHFSGGISGWKKAGEKVEKSDK